MSATVETILLYTIGAGLLSIVYGFLTGKNILNSSAGNAKMQEIASAIQIGAKAYLARQYKTIAIVGAVVLVIVSIAFSPLVGLGYLIGATLSGIAGYVGMLVSVEANVRTAVLTFASTETNIPTYPAIPDNVAPIRYPRPTKGLNAILTITKTTAPTIAIVLYCLARYAFAPIWIADAISCILAFPALELRIFLPVKNP